MSRPSEQVIWHDLECGSYDADLSLWAELARTHGGPVLDVGAGTGRVSLELARRGVAVVALDAADELVAELRRRARGLPVETVVADARAFALRDPVPLAIVPMQTIQLLGGADGRARFLRCARAGIAPGGMLAIAIADALEPFDVQAGFPPPLPDVGEFDGTVYASRPLAVRERGAAFVLQRRREIVSPAGELRAEPDEIALDRLSASTLETEGTAAGFTIAPRLAVPETADYVGSTVVMLGG